MADDTTQRAVHRFFAERLTDLSPFTKQDVQRITGWADRAVDTYWSKQFKGILEPIGNDQYRMRERFRQYLDWRKFKNLVTQVKTSAPSYAPTVYENFVVYEFYLPLAHENALRTTLDSLFYRDVIMPRLHRIGRDPLLRLFPPTMPFVDDPKEAVFERAAAFVSVKFGGYSIYHVDGRFRASGLTTQAEATELQRTGGRYLVDETTAVVRFIFPCKETEADTIRFLFEALFMQAITDQVSGEDEIWVVESGLRNRIHIWKPGGNDEIGGEE